MSQPAELNFWHLGFNKSVFGLPSKQKEPYTPGPNKKTNQPVEKHEETKKSDSFARTTMNLNAKAF